MAKYTYDDFLREAEKYYVSDEDKKLAESNPDAGMSLLQYKNDYANATTDAEKALANAGAEAIRKQYGGYTAGVGGDGYYTYDPTPSSFVYDGTAPA